MNRFVALALMVFCVVRPTAFAQGLDDDYVQIFRLIQDADALSKSAPSQALAKYLDAQTALDRLHKGSPDWNTRMVDYRLSYLADRIASLSKTTSMPPAASTNEAGQINAPVLAEKPAPLPDYQAQIQMLQTRIGQMQSDKSLLEAKLKEALAMRPAAADPGELARAEDKIKALQKENELLKVTVVEKQKPVAVVPTAESARIKQLETERNELQKQLESALKEKSARKGKTSTPQVQDLENQLAMAHTRLDALEARAVPYTPEEMELLKHPEAKLAPAPPNTGKKSIKELPPGSAALVADAQRYFAAKQYGKAESAYLQVLQQDPKNVPTLANLAAIQVEAEEFDKADANIKKALAQDPEDSYSLYVLGILRFRQAKYDEALDALSHAAKLDPQNAEVQNYLGLALSEKGLRVPAEAALRKAIQLQPGYGGAHYNLAVVYATQKPPATELARWHYQKALAAGHPRNPDLEKKFETSQ